MKTSTSPNGRCSHRAVVLFLILVVAIAGAFSFTQAGPAGGPELLRAVDDGHRHLAGRDRAADAGRGAQPHGEEVRAARSLREGRHLCAPGLRRHDDHREGRHLAARTSAKPGTRRARSSRTSSASCPKASSARSFNDEYGDVYGLIYAVKGDGIGHADLSDIAEDIKRRLLKVPMVKKVDLYRQAGRTHLRRVLARAPGRAGHHAAGDRREPDAARTRCCPPARSTPARDRVVVRVSGQFTNEDDIRNVPIAAGGQTIKLGDIATVRRGYEDPPTYTVRHNGQQVLMLGSRP